MNFGETGLFNTTGLSLNEHDRNMFGTNDGRTPSAETERNNTEELSSEFLNEGFAQLGPVLGDHRSQKSWLASLGDKLNSMLGLAANELVAIQQSPIFSRLAQDPPDSTPDVLVALALISMPYVIKLINKQIGA